MNTSPASAAPPAAGAARRARDNRPAGLRVGGQPGFVLNSYP